MTSAVQVQGYCDPRFAAAKELFQMNFDSGLELGASFAATVGGRFVVDIWGGYADEARKRPWERDTIVNVFSTTKAMTALCALMLVDGHQLDLDAPVATYWPEFGQNGKKTILVRHLLSHMSGVAGFDTPVSLETLCDWDMAVSLLARQKPWWEPGTSSGYHAWTFGYLLGELVRRITGRTIGAFFREEIAGPLEADFYIGVPEAEDARVAELIPPREAKPGDAGYIKPGSMLYRVLNLSETRGLTELMLMTRQRSFRAAEIPAVNGHGNARSVARIASAIACEGTIDGVRLLGPETIEKAMEKQYSGMDLAGQEPECLGLGFLLNDHEAPIGPNPRTLRGQGGGGSEVIMDLDTKLCYAYVMNKMGDVVPDPRPAPIAAALYDAL